MNQFRRILCLTLIMAANSACTTMEGMQLAEAFGTVMGGGSSQPDSNFNLQEARRNARPVTIRCTSDQYGRTIESECREN